MAGGLRQKKAVIVGAGAGGIATAARLAKLGYDVHVYEKNSYTGGRCSLIDWEGHRFDRGPSLLLIPEAFKTTFTDLGTSLEAEGVELLRCDPNYRLHFHDGDKIELSTSLSTMKREVEKYEGKDGFRRYLSFLQESHDHYELSMSHVLSRPFPSVLFFLRLSFLAKVFKMHPFESHYSRASKYFKSERLRRAFTFGTMYMGMSPFEAPATYSLLPYTELAEGIWYPRGGFHSVLGALVNVAERLGARFHLLNPVKEVTLDPRTDRANGITLVSGEHVPADLVIVNADLVTAYTYLLPQTDSVLSYAKSLRQKRTSCSSISFYWAVSTPVPELETHNIFLAEHYAESFDRIFRDHAMPEDPSFYVNVPSRVDASAAPADKETIVVLVPCGHLPTADDPHTEAPSEELTRKWKQLVEMTRSQILETIRSRTGVNVGELIVHEKVCSPVEWKEELNLDRGAILGLSHDFFNVLGFRPKMKAECGLEGLWFVGASTHPGTGVPVVLSGARILAEEVSKAEGDGYGRFPESKGMFGMLKTEWDLAMSNELKIGTKKKLGSLDIQERTLSWLEKALLGSIVSFLVAMLAMWVFWTLYLSKHTFVPKDWWKETYFNACAASCFLEHRIVWPWA